mmetsp:Transcript_14861/g.22265  ORF Transcript_14861/g.22265 Transcript_14861/m.22265 type:complete len:1492 (-) Transcript_14861:44-4519(-)
MNMNNMNMNNMGMNMNNMGMNNMNMNMAMMPNNSNYHPSNNPHPHASIGVDTSGLPMSMSGIGPGPGPDDENHQHHNQNQHHTHHNDDNDNDHDNNHDHENHHDNQHNHVQDVNDDPGQDHADDGSEDSDDPNASIIWSPQSQQSTCEFTHTIGNYSQKRESGCKKAEYSNTTIDNYGNRWRLIVYVNGNGRASNHHLSLFLQVADADDLPFGWKKAVSYVLTLEHPNGANLGYAKRNPDKTFKLCPKAIDWGWSQFITSDRIQQDGYISNDSLTVRASVTVKSSSISIDPEDAELYLKCAVEDGNAEAVEACLTQGASVNCQFKDDLYTPLHTACSSSASDGSLDVLNLLLQRGADGNACNKWRETPLLIAANNGHKAAVEALLKSGADPSMCSEAGWSALTFAAHKGYHEIVELLLLARAPVNCRVIEDMSTPLHKACAGGKDGHLQAVKQLLEGGADVHALNKWRETPLLTAANHGQADAVAALLDSGADPCRCTDTGWSPLSIAAYKGHDDVVELLLEMGAPTEEADPTLSALLQAATKGLPNTVELLLQHGADHTVTTKKGDTALSILIEQNLIDAAVEMVTEYKASIPRCSRDRKKVQRARLLINHRVKQQKEEGLWKDSDVDDSDHDDSDEESKSALHDYMGGFDATRSGSKPISNKKKGKKGAKKVSAEDKASAAAEALLLQLEQEDEKAQKEEAAATSKRNKKKKKKERERQQKLVLQKARKEKEAKEAQEREDQRRLKEDKDRKERDAKAKELREKELQEAAKRQEKATAKRKEKEDRENKRRQQEIREKEKLEKDRLQKEKRDIDKREKERKEEEKLKREKAARDKTKAQEKLKKEQMEAKATMGSKRGWETKANPMDAASEKSNNSNTSSLPMSSAQAVPKATVEDQLENMANDVVDLLGLDDAALMKASGSNPGSLMTDGSNETEHTRPQTSEPQLDQEVGEPLSIEAAQISLFRQEKVTELLHRTTSALHSPHPLASIDSRTIQTVLYKWIIRASYDSSPFLDPLIPSWTDSDMLVAFFQRQLISESRKSSNGIASNIEIMKEAGTFLAEVCVSLANEIVEFRKDHVKKFSNNCSDSTLGMSASEMMNNDGSRIVTIDWAGQATVYLPMATFSKLRNRYTGLPNSFFSAMFSLVKRYETLFMILNGSELDCRLSASTLDCLTRELKVNIELWTDPLCVRDNNNFCGIFSDMDPLFGASRSFVEPNSSVEQQLLKIGGSVAVLPTMESNTASYFIKRMLNILEATEGKGIPISCIAFLPMQTFRDLSAAPRFEDLSLVDPRLLQSHKGFIRNVEFLAAGQHTFQYGDFNGQTKSSNTGSIVLLLQNDTGSMHYPVHDQTIAQIVHTMSANFMVGSDAFSSLASNQPSNAYTQFMSNSRSSSIPSSPVANNQPLPDFSGRDNNSVRGNGTQSRRGRLFDLVDDGEDEFANADEMVSGMLLNIGMFQDSTSQDVNVEEISLMGIGAPSDSKSMRTTGRFG